MGSNHKHTPGPWLFDANPGGYAIYSPIKDGKTYRICSIGPVDCVQTEERNARLLWAAPELLAACEAACAVLDDNLTADERREEWQAFGHAGIDDYDRRLALRRIIAVENLRAAIAKATQ